MITDAVHFISMRTKTARGTHYHITEEDRALSASLFMPLHTDIFYQRRHCCLTRTVCFLQEEEVAEAGGGGRRKTTQTDREADREEGIRL